MASDRLVPTGRKRSARPAFKPGTTFVVGLTLASTGSLQCVRGTQGRRPIRSPGGAGASPLGVPRTLFGTCPPYDVVGAASRGQPIGRAVWSAVARALPPGR